MTAPVPFLNLRLAYEELQEGIEEAMLTSTRSGWYIGGADLAGFETDFARFTEAAHCVGVANGLDALHLALRACGIGPGDEVLVPSNTFVATWLAVSQVGAVPVPVEPDPATHTITAEGVEAAITPKTRAVMPVHLYGCPAPIDAIVRVARNHGLKLVEDAAQCHGARWNGRRIGAHSDAVAWSFYPSKNLGAQGDAGAVTTDDPEIAEAVRMLGNYGSQKRYFNQVKGFNSRLDPVQAAVLSVKLPVLDDWNARRAAVAARYGKAFAGLDIGLPETPAGAEPVWHLYVVRVADRDGFQQALTDRGVQTLIHYPCAPHRQEAYREMNALSLPVAERLADEVISLPMGPHMSDDEVARVIAAVQAVCAGG